jgi:hypothetical protein
MDNTVDGFGCYPTANTVFNGFNILVAGQEKTHPGFIIGNLAAAYEGANPYAPNMPAPYTTTFNYFKISMQTSAGTKVESSYHSYLAMADNVAHQASSQLPAPISGASIPAGNLNKVSVPNGSTAGVEVGMGIADSLALIPSNSKVKSVTPGTGTAPDTILLTVAASGPGTGDTVSFIGPKTVGWSFVNDFYNSILQVNRTNETTTGTIEAVPVKSPGPPKAGQTTPVITIIDPAASAGGLPVDPMDVPTEGEVLVAAAGAASWQSVSVAMALEPPAGGKLSGTYPDPGFSSSAVTVVTESGTVALPEWATAFRVVCVGGGGGGGGGTSSLAGAGGASGTSVEQVIEIDAPTTLVATIGTGGGGGGAGSGSSAGEAGSPGGTTEVVLGQVTMAASGGPAGSGAVPGTATAPGGAYGGSVGTTTLVVSGSSGGAAGQAGGDPFVFSPGGGGGGGGAANGSGGGGGGGGTPAVGGASGATGGATSGVGQAGIDATTPGAGGGGGGSGFSTSAGGAGGDGLDGFVIVEVVR